MIVTLYKEKESLLCFEPVLSSPILSMIPSNVVQLVFCYFLNSCLYLIDGNSGKPCGAGEVEITIIPKIFLVLLNLVGDKALKK